MEIKVLSAKNQEKGKIKLPEQFSEPVRDDIISKAVLALQSSKRQRYGAKPDAGLRASADVSRRRRKYRGSYGHGISRVPRKVLTRRGTQFFWVGAVAPGTVGGRKAHAPKADKDWTKKLNKKEGMKAIRSALSASLKKDIVEKRGHKVPESFPFALDSSAEEIKTAKAAAEMLKAVGLGTDIERGAVKNVRKGKGKSRGRKYKRRKGPLVIVSGDCMLLKSAKNIEGVDIADVNSIDVEMLAPGAVPGRLAVFTQKALEEIGAKKLYM